MKPSEHELRYTCGVRHGLGAITSGGVSKSFMQFLCVGTVVLKLANCNSKLCISLTKKSKDLEQNPIMNCIVHGAKDLKVQCDRKENWSQLML